MAEHNFTKDDVKKRLKRIKNKTLGEIDDKGVFDSYNDKELQKGIAGEIIEKCVFEYPSDCKQEPDLNIDGVKTELKTTGLIYNNNKEWVAKENVSVTAVSVYTNASETFQTSHFLSKTEHLLFVYYKYLRKRNERIKPIEYKPFPIIGYKFYDLPDDEKDALKKDWENVHGLICDISQKYGNNHDKEWEKKVKDEYINRRHEIRDKGLNYIDLAPKWPPRFRLKSSYITYIYNKKDSNYESIDLDMKDLDTYEKICVDITKKFTGKTIREISKILNFDLPENKPKNIGEMVFLKMLGCKQKKMSKIDFFAKEGIIPKTIVLLENKMPKEDTKFFRVDFDEVTQKRFEYFDDNNDLKEREFEFEDSEFYRYFTEHQFLGILFKKAKGKDAYDDIFIGTERLFFDKKIIEVDLKKLWDDTREKIFEKKLKDVPTMKKNKQVILKNGELSFHPNFMPSSLNSVFIKLSGKDSTTESKTEEVNGIKMVPQYVWIRKKTIKEMLEYEMPPHIYDLINNMFEK